MGYGYLTGKVDAISSVGPTTNTSPPLGKDVRTTKLFSDLAMGQRLYVGSYEFDSKTFEFESKIFEFESNIFEFGLEINVILDDNQRILFDR